MPMFFGQRLDLCIAEPHYIENTPSPVHSLKLYFIPQTRDRKSAPHISADAPKIFNSMQGRRSMPSRREAARLPRIAPRTGAEPSNFQIPRPVPPPRNLLPNVARTRLPPRSRSGCWTCRRRKVKCDEQRPDCGQCSRLGHECDYNPRLAFKDDLSTAMKRTQDITSTGNSVWISSLPTPKYGPFSSGQDLLGPFSTLSNDEDREKKAQMMAPGTYIVIANPSSFASLPEYYEDVTSNSEKRLGLSYSDRRMFDAQKPLDVRLGRDEVHDPNIIILRTFEGHLRRNPISPTTKPELIFTTASQPSITLEAPAESIHILGQSTDTTLSRLDEARRGGRDTHLLSHYRSHLSERVIKVGSRDVVEDVFEIESRTFPPLFHAMMAISALSLAHRGGVQNREALDHYVQVVPAMRRSVRSEEDSNSDGAFFTHYLLLLYEIASAGRWESNMWQTHSRTLQKIISRRRKANQTEPHGFIVFVICLVDCYAQLSGSGDGAFVDFIMKNNMLTPQDILPPLAPGKSRQYFDEELPYFPSLLELNQQVILLAAKVGGTARVLRAEYSQRQVKKINTVRDNENFNVSGRFRAQEVQNLCRTMASEWEVRYPQFWSRRPAPKTLPRRVREFWDHVYTLYRACVIYSHTSLYPGQLANLMGDSDAAREVFTSVTEIIELSRQVVMDERWEYQFLPFSLFLSGIVSRKQEEKALAINLMIALERESYGENTASIRHLLETVYDKQRARTRTGEDGPEVDWLDVMETTGTRLVMFGM